ncbi:Uncharacterised protein [Vibrio cholerae]|nr:Uncharacterised protein [Vibrio cholerae]CSB34304.1 Uncharacterised protein [Vibrio cholerae]
MKPKSVRRVFISVCCCSMRKRFSAGKILACGSMSIRAVSLFCNSPPTKVGKSGKTTR